MKPVYAVRCGFHGNADDNAARAWDSARRWLGHEERVEIPSFDDDSPSGATDLTDGQRVGWRIVRSGPDVVGRLVHDVPPGGDELAWRTLVWVCSEGGQSWGVVRSGPQNPAGVVTTLRFDAKRPRLISQWVEELQVVADGRRLGEQALNYGQGDAEALLELLQHPGRRLPILTISRGVVDGVQRPLMRVDGLAYRLAGNAHVVVLDRAGCWAVTEAIGKPLSVYEGAVRLWWPRFSTSDDPYRHTLVLGDRIKENPKRVEETFVRRIWSAAVDALGPPALEARLVSERSRLETERRLEELKAKSSDSAEWEELLEEQIEENSDLREQVDDLQADIDDLRLALDEARTQADLDEEDDEELEDVATVEEAVRIVSGEATNVIFLESAFAAARESKYPEPRQVLKDLRALCRVAETWGRGELSSGFKGGFATEPVTYREGISQTASTKYRSDYEIDYGGSAVMMGPHLRRGVGSPESILRIYWYVDDGTRQLVVGHVGKKLRDKKNS